MRIVSRNIDSTCDRSRNANARNGPSTMKRRKSTADFVTSAASSWASSDWARHESDFGVAFAERSSRSNADAAGCTVPDASCRTASRQRALSAPSGSASATNCTPSSCDLPAVRSASSWRTTNSSASLTPALR